MTLANALSEAVHGAHATRRSGPQAALLCALTLLTGCHHAERLHLDPRARFAGYEKSCSGIPGEIPPAYVSRYLGVSDARLTSRQVGSPTASGYDFNAVLDGLCTWYLWQGGDPAPATEEPDSGGNPRFWRALEQKTAEIRESTHQPVVFTLLGFLDSRRRHERFRTLGVINDPGCEKSTAPDAFGLYLDRCGDPYASGIIGIRLNPNPKFDPKRWNASSYFDDPRTFEPPYLAGLTCASCHVAFNPLLPPADPEHPRWENLAGAIGNQYLREGAMFEGGLTPGDFLWHVYALQQPGTSDTSRLSVDWIDNPGAINPIFSIDSIRPRFLETMNDGSTATVPHILKDGADSIGAAGAALRVYVNIGTCGATRMAGEDVLLGLGRAQSPFDLARAEAHCRDFQQTSARIANAATFLDSQQGFPLAEVEGGRHLAKDEAQMAAGRRAFAENCARCHSSKVPAGLDAKTKHDLRNRPRWIALVERADFLTDNFLSDDGRYPIVDPDWRFAIGTNIKRAMGTNAAAGHVWQDFSSKTSKEQPSPGTIELYNPFDPAHPIAVTFPKGRGYYRVPSLIAVWATAPLLHNNSLGAPTQDPSVAGRLRAFEDAMEKMFHPAARDGVKSIKRTSQRSVLRLGRIRFDIPEGTPVDLIANIDLRALLGSGREPLLRAALERLTHPQQSLRIVEALKSGRSNAELLQFANEMLAFNGAPDFIEDHGHEFGSRLAPDQQRALVEYMKTF